MWRNEKVLRTNLCTNPNFTTGITGWNTSNASQSRDTTSIMDTAGSLKLTGSGVASNDSYTWTGVAAGTSNKFPGMAAGGTYTISADALIGAAFTGSLNSLAKTISVYLYAPSLAGGTSIVSSSAATTTKSRLSVTFTIPADATGWAFRLYNGSDSATDIIYWDKILVENSSIAKTYFDGSLAAAGGISYRWNGTVNFSTSDQYLPTLVAPPQSLNTLNHLNGSLNEVWYCDNYDLQTYAFGVTLVDQATPELRGDSTTIPQRDGVQFRVNRSYDSAELSLSMWVLGCEEDGSVPSPVSGKTVASRSLFSRNLSALLKIMGAQNKPVTLTRVRWAPSDGSAPVQETLNTRAVCTGSTSISAMAARKRAELVFTFTLVDSFWTSTTSNSVTSTSGSLSVILDKMGDAPIADSVVTVTGPIASPTVTCPESGVSFTYNGNLTAGQQLVVDSSLWTAMVGSTNVINNMTHTGHSRFMYLPPRAVLGSSTLDPTFAPTVVLSGSGTTAATSVKVDYSTKYQLV